MAYPVYPEEGLTREQAEALRELNSFEQVSHTDAWKKIIARLKANVDEALEEMLGCPPTSSLETRGVLQMRWQQREAIHRDLIGFVESQIQERTQLTEEIKEQHEYTSDHSGDPGNNDQQ